MQTFAKEFDDKFRTARERVSSQRHHNKANGKTPRCVDWLGKCETDKQGKPFPNLANAMIALRSDPTVKDAFAYAHKAVATLTNDNLMQTTVDPFNPKGQRTRVDSASIMSWHTYDHYGQMVEYLRMNNIVPPASR